MPARDDLDRWRRINEIFQDAVALTAERRHRFLAEVCAGNGQLRHAVERLLDAHERAAGFLARPAAADAPGMLALDQSAAATVHLHPTDRVEVEFRGTERFRVLSRLGAGGMGVVYAAHDVVRDQAVALKTLLRPRPADVSRLKREFRSLADVAHVNLVCLHELVVDPETCFFTMELVDGVLVSEYVRSPATAAGSAGAWGRRADPGLARSVVRQLVAGLSALHGKGKLHRDIKPSNIMVRRDGRLIVLDFGLISDNLPGAAFEDDGVAGTPAYLAPEQHWGADPSEATDWYAVGVTLYETLTGRRPFEGSWYELRQRKIQDDPRPPAWIDPGIPDDLNEICMGLLCRDPGRRLSGPEALGKLSDARISENTPPSRLRRTKPSFIGRTDELTMLNGSFAAVSQGRAMAVCVHGPSGIGKTALVQQFLDRLPHGDATVVLRGRCYQQESVPYEALDGIIESLSTYLLARPAAQAAALVPPEAGALARVFPAMLQVQAVAQVSRNDVEDPEPSALRRQAFSALRELLRRIAQRHTLVLYIDDLHWADADSMRLLEFLVRPPGPPPLLLLTCLRTEEIASKPFLQTFLEGAGMASRIAVTLGPLTEDETRDVMASMLPAAARITPAERLALSREAGGNPFLLEQLAHFGAAHDGGGHRATLADMLLHRLRDAPDGARRFLEVLAVCGRPMAPQLVYEAAGLAGDERPLVAILRSDHLLRHSGSASRIEMYHDRMRETLAAQLPPEVTRSIHGHLVRTLTERGADDPEALFEHCRGAGDRHGAARQAARAATRAHAVLAFDRAAFFHRSALELLPDDPAAAQWKQGLADALANAGRPPEAAPVYLEAATSAQGWRRIELQRRAAEQFLVAGHVDEGLDEIRAVLHALHMRWATSPGAALASLVWRRARIRWRGLAFVAHHPDQIPADRLLRIDTCWSVATGLALVDFIRAADFNTRHLLLALEAGEPYRIARALALEAGFLTCGGNLRIAAECAERAASLARQSHPHAEGLSALTAGMSALLSGEWTNASRHCERALAVLRQHCPGATWEMNCAEIFLLGALLFQGDIHEVSRRLPSLLAGAADRGHRFFETELRTRMNLVWLGADRPDEGERHAIEVMKGWSHEAFHGQHYSQALARIQTALYRGDAEAAWRAADDTWPALRRSLLLQIEFVRIEASYLRARAALLCAARGREVARFLSIARGDARRIGRFGRRWSDAIALLLSAAVANLEGRTGAARDLLAAAATAFERADMGSHAAAARRRLGELLGNERGRELIADADAWMASHGIKHPARMTRMFAPGFTDPEEA
jgi:hypothetical protein